MLKGIRKIIKTILPAGSVSKLKGMVGVLPDFLIIGSQKCGTTSLYNYLTSHPCIYPASEKEVGFFDRWPNNGITWYKSQFPSLFYKFYLKNISERKYFLTGEASTGYVLYPHALRRISATLPSVKLILVLRNPVDRAYSHYQHTCRIGKENLPFEIAIQREEERVASDWDNLRTDSKFFSTNIYLYSYCCIGKYFEQVKELYKLFSKENILILQSEELFESPKDVLNQTYRFLNIPNYDIKHYKRHNSYSYKKMDPKIRKDLNTYFKPYNENLFELLGVKPFWE